MNRPHVPHLDNDQLGKKGVVGWYFEDVNEEYAKLKGEPEGKIEVVFQGPCNHRFTLELHSIAADGEVNASVLCYEQDYHEFVVLDGWPTNMSKEAGKICVKVC